MMKDETPPGKKGGKRKSTKADSQTRGKEGKEELRRLLLGTLGLFGGVLWLAYHKTISPTKKPKSEVPPEAPPKKDSVEELARHLRELLASPPLEGQEEIRKMRQKEVVEKLQSTMKPEDWPRVQEILRKPKSPQER